MKRYIILLILLLTINIIPQGVDRWAIKTSVLPDTPKVIKLTTNFVLFFQEKMLENNEVSSFQTFKEYFMNL